MRLLFVVVYTWLIIIRLIATFTCPEPYLNRNYLVLCLSPTLYKLCLTVDAVLLMIDAWYV